MESESKEVIDEADGPIETAAASPELDWVIGGRRLPKLEMVFLCQIVLIYVVTLTCVVNLTMGNGNSNLWTALLSSCLGYMLPSPSPLPREKTFKTRERERGRSL